MEKHSDELAEDYKILKNFPSIINSTCLSNAWDFHSQNSQVLYFSHITGEKTPKGIQWF